MKIYILLILCVSFWAENFILGRFIRFELEPMQLAFFRWLGVSIVFLPQLIKYRKEIFSTLKKHFFYMISISFLGISCFNTFLYIGLQDTTAVNALLINSSIPIIIILFSVLLLKICISLLQFLGVIISMGGVVFLALNGNFSNLLSLTFNKGDIWIIASSFSWGLYSTMLKLKPKNIKAFLPTIVLLGTLLLTPAFFIKGHNLSDIFTISLNAKLVILYTIFFASIISFYLWNEGVEKIGANKTGQFTHLMPLIGTISAYIFLDEKIHLYHIFGFLFIGFGIYLSVFYKKEK